MPSTISASASGSPKSPRSFRATTIAIIIDCPPGLTDTSDQILRASDLVVVPVIPSALSQRSLDVIKEYVGRKKGPKVTLAPVFSMVDRRRGLHQAELDKHSGWPAIPDGQRL